MSTVLLYTWFRAASRLFRKYTILPVGDLQTVIMMMVQDKIMCYP